MERAAEVSYREAAKSLEVFGLDISHTETGRILERVGREVHAELYGPDAQVEAASQSPPNAPEILAAVPDGSRYRTNEADAPRRTEDTPPEDRGWRENKVGVIARMLPGSVGTDGAWTAPVELTKTYVATTGDVRSFGRDLRTEAERRGLSRAKEVVCPSDNGHGIPGMIEREFPDREVHRITDFFHGAGRLGEVAAVVKGEAAPKARWSLFRSLKADLWEGKTKRLTTRLKAFASRRAPGPDSLTELDPVPEAKALWEHALYFEKHAGTMDYPEYRKKGWPVASGSVESACGRIGNRVKHARMRWRSDRADAVHAVKAAIMSEDGRWDRRWPGPIPILEASAHTMAACQGN
jgi:hypothetical protein